MLDLKNQRIILDGNTTAIRFWHVWFYTPVGLIDRLQDAVARCEELDLLPALNIKPVPVAIDKDGRYEVHF